MNTRSGIVADVTRRMNAILSVFDDDLGRLEEILLPALSDVVLPAGQWKAAQDSRARVEQSLRSLETSANEAVQQASDWQRRAKIADRDGRADMASQARQRADLADAESRAYFTEADAVREFLREWDIRVRQAG